MIKSTLLGLAALVIFAAPCAAQTQWGVYSPDMKFSDVFGRPAAVDVGATVMADPSLADVAANGTPFLKDGINGLLASAAPGATRCEDLSSLKLPWVRIRSAKMVPAEKATRAYCQVIGVVDKEITFEVDMPDAASWNGKYLMGGGGGMLGTLGNGSKEAALARGYATGATDTGHVQPKDGGGSWADNNPDRVTNWGYRGTHLAQANSKLVIQAYYKKAITQSYFYGSSGSGRVAMMEAERYPADFNGIIAQCPAINWTRMHGIATTWDQQTMFPTMKDEFQYNPLIPATKVKMMDDAIYAKCDAVDGLKDNIISNPLACKFDPMVDLPKCKAGDMPNCFTTEQLVAIKKIHDGPSNATQGQIMPGWPYGGENVPGMWAQGGAGGYVIGTPQKPGADSPYASRHYLLTEETLRHLVFNDPNYDLHSFNFDSDLTALTALATQVDANNPDLSSFNAHHDKLIMSVGWSDWAVGGLIVKDFYDQMVKKTGPGTADFARLFLSPGVGHCGSIDEARRTPNNIDYLTALENWVEKGQAPDSLLASHVVPVPGQRGDGSNMPITGKVDRTRPVCAYPAVDVYNGKGNVDDAANFTCKVPAS